MPIPAFLLLMTLAPAVCGVLIAALGFGRRALAPLALGLAVLGALIPAVGMLILAPALEAGGALFFTILGGTIGDNDWFSPAYRVDSLGIFAALGIAFIVAPLLVWMAWQRGAATEATADLPASRRVVVPAVWGGLALALGVETVALTLVFADNVLWLALAWVLLAALAWGLGEVGSEPATLDRPGLGLMLAGPILWTLFLFIPAITYNPHNIRAIYPRFTQMMGNGAIQPLHALALVFALALASGAYPFVTWVRARAALITPAGLAALALAVLPVALFVGARTYSAAQNASNQWQEIGKASPPITAGLFFALVGAVTVAVAGLLALDRRDARALLAYLAVAQVGWGLIALGTGVPAGIVGLVALLATAVFGLGALLATLYSAGALTSDIEPDAAGPRLFGAPIQPLRLAAWCAGALALLGAPLGAGFVARQLISAGAVQARGLPIPLTAIAWAGDALLGLALLRATAPAFTTALSAAPAAASIDLPAETANSVDEDEDEGGDTDAGTGELDDALASVSAAAESAESLDVVEDDADEVEVDAGEADVVDEPDADEHAGSPRPPFRVTRERVLAWLVEAPAVLLALLAVIVAVAPQALLAVGAIPGASALLQPGAANTVVPATLGYAAGPILVLPTLAWLAFAVLLALRVFLVPAGARQTRPVFLAGQAEPISAETAGAAEAVEVAEGAEPAEVAASAEPVEGAEVAELAGLPAPDETWHELRPAFTSGWTLPGSEWLLKGLDDESAEAEVETEEEEALAAEEEAEAEPESEDVVADEELDEEAEEEPVAEATEEAPEPDEESIVAEEADEPDEEPGAETGPEAPAAMDEPEAGIEETPAGEPSAPEAEIEPPATTTAGADELVSADERPEAGEETLDLAALADEDVSAVEQSEAEVVAEQHEPDSTETRGGTPPVRKPRKQPQKPARSRERATTRSRKRSGGGRA